MSAIKDAVKSMVGGDKGASESPTEQKSVRGFHGPRALHETQIRAIALECAIEGRVTMERPDQTIERAKEFELYIAGGEPDGPAGENGSAKG